MFRAVLLGHLKGVGAMRGGTGLEGGTVGGMAPPPALPQVSLQKESQGSGTFESLRLGPLR